MTSLRTSWHTTLVRLGRHRATALITGISIALSLALTAVLANAVGASGRELWLWYGPAVLVPLVVAPIASRLVLSLAFALEEERATTARQEAELRAVFTHAPIGIARLTVDGSVRTANPSARALLGLASEHDSGVVDPGPSRSACEAPWEALFVEAEDRRAFERALALRLPLDSVRWRWHGPDGASRIVRAALVPMPAGGVARDGRTPSADETERGIVLLLDDITERESVEGQLLRAQKLDLVGRLTGGLAHDFNNLLTVVRASVSALGGAEASAELAAIDDAARRGARLTRRLLSISRRAVLSPAPQRLEPLLFDAVDLMRRVLPPRVRLETPAEVPDVVLALDHDAIQQALLNLVVNARDAMPGEGVIRITTDVRERDDGAMLVLAVHDTGSGMAPDVLARASEPFFSTKASHQGTGLGLAIVHSTMQRHGGRLLLHSTPGAGTRAELWFPVVAEPAAARPTSTDTRDLDRERIRRRITPEATPVVPVGGRVLLVEDELEVRVATERALRRLGYEVVSVGSVSAALELVQADASIAAVLSDVMMPEATGFDLLRTLRDAGRTLPALFVSGFALESLDRVHTEDGRTAFLAKPWTVGTLAEALTALGLEPPRDPSGAHSAPMPERVSA
ncbi:MAG TPA: ATP-binding protein [Gemmatimonadaceae bacterium]|nr:ATP-binding protein [Gemmatimonadaceae bacterium]